ncbi:MAG: hypothetical protein MOGMAGMI_01834 [Candidatus Omnitrophica bacterium]|nr:hypothetical protein [Candidatus Omnitrophota bacterium]
MRSIDMPNELKRYVVSMSNKSQFVLTGIEKQFLLESKDQLIEISRIDGLINKAHIVEIQLDTTATQHAFDALPAGEKVKLLERAGDSLAASTMRYLEGGAKK